MANPSSIHFFYLGVHFGLESRTRLKKYIIRQVEKESRKLKSLNYIFCSDKKLLEMNRQYLKHDYYTDIITFEYSENSREIVGEIYISVDRVRENAKILRTTFKEEIHRVIFHGILHLLGFKDKTSSQKRNIRKLEDQWLKKYFV